MADPQGNPTASACPLREPVRPGDRHEIIDIVRGFALFGVLLANMVQTTQDLAITDALRDGLPTAGIDTFGMFVTGTLIDGKFFTLFSMLFGLGFAVQLSRASHRGVDVLPTYTRRLIILFSMGALHGLLLWFGDVLHIYALLGFVLILFRNRSDRTVLLWALGSLLFVMCTPLVDWLAETAGYESPMAFGRVIPPGEMYETLRHGGYFEVVRLNWLVHLQDYGQIGFGNILVWYLDILSKFLLGFYVGRRMLLQRVHEHRDLFRRVLPWALVLGLAGNVYMNAGWAYDIGRPDGALARHIMRSLHEVWVLSLSIGYVCALVALHQRARPGRYVRCLAPVGRMALTNYLSHSICFLALFYGIGLGLLGEVGTAACILLSIAIFGLQIALSGWWLKRFRFGPVEWLWRSLTYGSLQPMRVRRDPE